MRGSLGLLVLCVAGLLLLTLTPTSQTGPGWAWWCLVCGADALRDARNNLLLFVPFGLSLALRGRSAWAALALGFLLSSTIELLQFFVPGRTPSVRDLGANALGSMAGALLAGVVPGAILARTVERSAATLGRWRDADGPLATRLLLAAFIGTIGLLAISGRLLSPALPPEPLFIAGGHVEVGPTPLRIGAVGADFGFFKGAVDEVRVYARPLDASEVHEDAMTPVGTAGGASRRGLVAAFAFEEREGDVAFDASPFRLEGRLRGAVRTAGRFGQAVGFDGVDSEVLVPYAPSLDLPDGFTLEAWVRPGVSHSPWPAVLEKEGDQYYLYAGDDVEPLLASGGGMFGGANEAAVLPVPLVAGEWRHLAVTYDGSMIRMYVDGRPTSELTRWYAGRIDGVWVADSLLPQGPIPAPWVRAALARNVSLRVVGVAGPTTPARAPVIDVRTRRGKHAVLLSAVGEDLVLSRSSVGTELGWYAPEIRFRGALRALRSGEPLEIRLEGDRRFPIVGVNGWSTGARGVTLGSGWRVALRSELLPRPIGALLDLVWIGGLACLATFWARGVGRWSAVTLALGAMLALLSVWASLAPVSAMEWSAFVAGTVASRLGPGMMQEGQVESVSPIQQS